MVESEIFCPEWQKFERELGFRPLLQGPTYGDLVKQSTQLGLALSAIYDFPPADDSIRTTEEKTATGIRLKIYTPSALKSNRPIVLYMHGGGCVLGSVDEDDAIVRKHAKDTGLRFVSVEYKLAPHFPYPDGLNDCVEAARWCVENAESLGCTRKVLLMGVSAGGTLALATALKIVGGVDADAVQGVAACQPFTLHPDAVPYEFEEKYKSYEEHAENTINGKSAMKSFLDIHGAPKNDPAIFSALSKRLGQLPCVYLNACGADTLRDDARILRGLLDKKSVLNRYDEFQRLPHFFFAYPSQHLDGVREDYFAKTAAGILFVVQHSDIDPLPLS